MLRRRASWCGWLVLLAGCFSEPATAGTGDSGTHCVEATLGCACGPGGACEGDLQCEASVSLCIDPSCTPGQALCTCIDGDCIEGLSCHDGLCREPSGADTTAGQATTPGDDGVPTSGPSDEGASTQTTSTDPSGDSGVPTSDSSDPTEGPTGCAPECNDCFACSTGSQAPCEGARKVCDEAPYCTDLANCVKNCGQDPSCVQSVCCGNLLYQSGVPAFNDLAACVADECPCFVGVSCGS